MESVLKQKLKHKETISKEKDMDNISESKGEGITGITKNMCRVMDGIAGACMVLMMVLVVANVLLREIFRSPILGTYEYVGLISAIMVSLAIPYCALKGGHIAVTFFTGRLSNGMNQVIDIGVNTVSMIFWGFISWHIYLFAYSNFLNGVVSSTTQIPVFYFIYVIGIGLTALCLVLFTKCIKSYKKVVFGK